MHCRRRPVPAARRCAAGFTLLSVLVAMVILAFGLLGLARAYVAITAASTQNQNLSALAAQSNAFWGLVQANSLMLTGAPALAGSYTSANIATAPSALQPWLTQLLSATSPAALPQATVLIATGPDAASGSACSLATGCSVTLTISWVQGAKPGAAALTDITRSQIFYFQFGL